MDKKQYNNVIDYTLKHDKSAQTDDSLATARAIFTNMGVALPQGDIKEVFEVIKSGAYMSWRPCSMKEAQAAADQGIAAIGISEDRIVVLSANDEEQPITKTTSVMSISENTSALEVDGLKYFSYGRGRCGGGTANPYFANDSLDVEVGWNGYNILYGCMGSTIYWHSSNNNIATVDYYSGYINTHKCGKVYISAVSLDCSQTTTFELNIEPKYCRKEESKGFTWIINGGGIASYIVNMSLTYKIVESYSNSVKIENISAFIYTDKNPFALASPKLSIGTTTINGQNISMNSSCPQIVPTGIIWGSGECQLNSIVLKGSSLNCKGIAMLQDSPYPYRDIDIEMVI